MIQEWIEGIPMSVIIREGTQEQRDLMGTRLFELTYDAPRRLEMMHGDAHPGNFMLLPADKMGVIDFGAVAPLPGGFPIELPAISLAEPMVKPSTMLYRNFLAMETEELLRSYPADGAVLMGGCDKTTPAMLMGAISMNLPALFLPAGPMLRGDWRGKFLVEAVVAADLVELEGMIAAALPGCCLMADHGAVSAR